MRTEMDCLVLGDFFLDEAEQRAFQGTEDSRSTFTVD
jgi:hypothetical protein